MVLSRRRRKRRSLVVRRAVVGVASALTSLAVISAAPAANDVATVTMNSNVIGLTPQFLGYSEGHYMSGSNTSAWVGYSGVNSYRVWMNASDYEPPNSNYGDGVTSVSQFDIDKAAVRASPENN